jgi:hypothetical protein
VPRYVIGLRSTNVFELKGRGWPCGTKCPAAAHPPKLSFCALHVLLRATWHPLFDLKPFSTTLNLSMADSEQKSFSVLPDTVKSKHCGYHPSLGERQNQTNTIGLLRRFF